MQKEKASFDSNYIIVATKVLLGIGVLSCGFGVGYLVGGGSDNLFSGLFPIVCGVFCITIATYKSSLWHQPK